MQFRITEKPVVPPTAGLSFGILVGKSLNPMPRLSSSVYFHPLNVGEISTYDGISLMCLGY